MLTALRADALKGMDALKAAWKALDEPMRVRLADELPSLKKAAKLADAPEPTAGYGEVAHAAWGRREGRLALATGRQAHRLAHEGCHLIPEGWQVQRICHIGFIIPVALQM